MRTQVILPALALGVAVVGVTVWVETARPSTAALVRQDPKPKSSAPSAPGFLRCETISTTPDAPPESDIRRTEADLFAAIVRLRMPDQPPPLIVESVSIPMPPFHGLLESTFPADLKARVVRGSPECFQLTADRFPPGARLVSLADIRQGVTRGRADWPSFRARFGGARMWFGFSRALIDADRRSAVVFYERQCDSLCGEAEWVWFQRASRTEPWRVMKEIWSWIS